MKQSRGGLMKKDKRKVLVHLEKGIDLMLDHNLTDKDLMVSIGMLTQFMVAAHEEHDQEKYDKEKLKEMLNVYINKIVDEVSDKLQERKKNIQ